MIVGYIANVLVPNNVSILGGFKTTSGSSKIPALILCSICTSQLVSVWMIVDFPAPVSPMTAINLIE